MRIGGGGGVAIAQSQQAWLVPLVNPGVLARSDSYIGIVLDCVQGKDILDSTYV